MLIIPTLYLSRGQCVSHYKGERTQADVLSKDPLHAARVFEKLGARRIHIIDLDAGPQALKENQTLAASIARNTSLEVGYGEAASTLEEIEALFEKAIARISLNQFSESLLAGALKKFGADRITFTIRAERTKVEGKEGIDIVDYGKDIADQGVTQIIFRDTKSEGTFHPNFDEVDRLVLGTPAQIFACGGIGDLSDIELLEKTGATGVLISRAFFEGKLSLRACLNRFTA